MRRLNTGYKFSERFVGLCVGFNYVEFRMK